MKNPLRILRGIGSRTGTLLLLFQRSPFVQMLLPEAKIAGLTGAGEAAKWTIATVAGLGAYDSVSGATAAIHQLSPNPNGTTATTAVGATFALVYQATGTEEVPGSWSVDFPLPPGTTHAGSTNSYDDNITGIPTEEGEYPVRVTAWEELFQTGQSVSQDFTIIVGPAVITRHPQSTTISSGGTAALNVVATGPGLSYQWFRGASPPSGTSISGATLANYTTPSLTSTTSYFVRVTRGTIISFSNPATVTISENNTFADWRNAVFDPAQLADLLISGPDADPDGDGFPNTKEYIFGTAPLMRESSPLSLTVGATDSTLAFIARAASGPGYAGRTRHYALEKISDLAGGTWTSPAGFSDITGTGQTVNHSESKNAEPTFYRLRVWLTP